MKSKPAMCIILPELICPGGEKGTIECNSIPTLWQGCWSLAELCERKAKTSWRFRKFQNPFRNLEPLSDKEINEEWTKRIQQALRETKDE